MRKNTNRNKNKIQSFFEMPEEIISKNPKITILGFDQMLIENYKGVIEYEDFYIRINTVLGVININGFNLNLNQMTEEDLIITGKLQSISVENLNDDFEV